MTDNDHFDSAGAGSSRSRRAVTKKIISPSSMTTLRSARLRRRPSNQWIAVFFVYTTMSTALGNTKELVLPVYDPGKRAVIFWIQFRGVMLVKKSQRFLKLEKDPHLPATGDCWGTRRCNDNNKADATCGQVFG